MDFDVEQVVREYIDKSIHMSLATTRDDKPWVCEVHFAYDNDLNLYFRSLRSRRHSQDIASNPNVAGNIVKQHAVDEYPHAIYFEGTAEMVTGDTQRQKIFPLFKERVGADESILEEAKAPDGHQFYKISVANWYTFGKFGRDHGGKDGLKWNGGAK
jgi:uncharacterized protein YhbP (UPF0306 family)